MQRHWDTDVLFLALNTQVRCMVRGRTDFVCFWARGSLKKGSLSVRLQPLAEETSSWWGSQGPPQGIPVLVEQERGW